MRLSAQSTNAIKFTLVMMIFSLLVFIAYSSGKKITDDFGKEKQFTIS